jgi:hypothetical protein
MLGLKHQNLLNLKFTVEDEDLIVRSLKETSSEVKFWIKLSTVKFAVPKSILSHATNIIFSIILNSVVNS